MVSCPICSKPVKQAKINAHIDSGCEAFVDEATESHSPQVASFFRTSSSKKPPHVPFATKVEKQQPQYNTNGVSTDGSTPAPTSDKRPSPDQSFEAITAQTPGTHPNEPPSKRPKNTAAQRAQPLAERMRPCTLDEVQGQDLVGPGGVLRGLIESDRVPSMILWGSAGTGKQQLHES